MATVLSSANISAILKNKKCRETVKEGPGDVDRHFVCRPGAIINDKYRIVKKLGKGYFGRVVEVIDMETEKTMALKISRNKSKCKKAAKTEIMTLRYISRRDPNNMSLCTKMTNCFVYNGHYCMTFELLGCDIYHFLKKNAFFPFPLNDVRHIAYQLCYSVNFLHRRGIIHTDLKPDNILFVDSSYTKEYNAEKSRNIRLINRTDIRLIDFGCAVGDEMPHSFTICNRYYRAPEVLLKLNWSHPADVWSIACILYELYTGNILFNTEEDNSEHFGIMEKVLGAIPHTMSSDSKFFTNGKSNFDWTERPLEVNCHQPIDNSMKSGSDDDLQLFDLMKQMLAYEPSKRITLIEALKHPFFDKLPSHQRLE